MLERGNTEGSVIDPGASLVEKDFQLSVDHYQEYTFSTGKPTPPEVFQSVVEEIRIAIDEGVFPSLISQGSSGSYFCRDRKGRIIGVFKPKNEEPYGDMNPKWGKWVQRNFFPCCFGRSCLIPNSGYLSEAAASVVDRNLSLNVVPATEVIQLASPSFNYSFVQKRQAKRGKPPLKIGSLQLFVNGYKDAQIFFPMLAQETLTDHFKKSFRAQFERLVILDYIIRNTDRGNQNWMIKILDEKPLDFISLAAIDHGLAFPIKHPDNWRNYPFGWVQLPAAQVPFSDETAEEFLQKLEDPDFIDTLVAEIRKVYQLDTQFKEDKFARQMSVLRGQIYNLVDALRRRKTPAQLAVMPPIVITQVVLEKKKGIRRWIFDHRPKAPTFTSC